jgi:DNA-binding NarL/FixJ family response regulator
MTSSVPQPIVRCALSWEQHARRPMATRIVLIDDHQIVRDGLKLHLQREPDFEIVGEAGDAAQAYDCMGRTTPDVVVLDLNLPGDHGLVAARRIRADWPTVKIVVLTGDAAETATQEALLAGANGFLRKVDAVEDLVRAIRVVIDGKTYLSPDAATALAGTFVKKSVAPPEPELSERELAVLKGLASGLSYKEIADQLQVSAKSVETYRARLARKTGNATRADLVRYAVRKGVVPP